MDDTTPPAPDPGSCAPLLSLVSHELRTPLSIVGGYLRMLQGDRAQFTDRQRKMIDEADKACASLLAMVDQIRDVAKIDDGRTTMQAERLDLFELVRQAAGETNEASDRGVRLEVRSEPGAAPLRGDRRYLKPALISLLRAVLREQLDESVVVVSLQLRPEGEALIVIARDAAAEEAAQTPMATFDEMRGGLGLALPLARRIVERHGGRIWSPAAADGTATARSAILVSLPVERA